MSQYIALLFFLISKVALANPESTECFSSKEPVPFAYCISSGNHRVLYEFHGRGEDERSWSSKWTYPALIRQAWQENSVDRPTVVSVSFGSLSLMVAKNSSPLSGRLELFEDVFLPQIENQLGFVPEERLAIGESMGGFYAMQVALRHRELFSKLVLLCPALATISPFASLADMQAYIKRNHAKNWRVFSAMAHARFFMPTPNDWQQADVFSWLDDIDPANFPEIYISAGGHDEFGFFEGAEKFADAATNRGFSVQWNPMWGDHCAVDVSSVVEFLK